ncbi:MAG: VWA domain-containing protein [Spirochaetaceae bacterium]
MFTLDGLSGIRKVRWRQLRPGAIILGGITVGDHPLPELMNFPVLTDELITTLLHKYKFLEQNEVLIADAVFNFNPYDLANQLKSNTKFIPKFNQIRDNFQAEKKMVLRNLGLDEQLDIPIISGNKVEKEFLIKDNYNSFTYMYGLDSDLEELPSMFHKPDLRLSIGDLLTNRVKDKFNIPDDKEVNLHIVVDFSKSMDNLGKLDLALAAVNSLYDFVDRCFKNTKINLYVFSDKCRLVEYPMDNVKIPRKDTNYSSFMKKILHHRDRDIHNSIILLTDGLPSDLGEALKMSELIKKNKIDYTQIIFQMKEEQRIEVLYRNDSNAEVIDNIVSNVNKDMSEIILNDEELDNKIKGLYSDFSEIATACGGNQIILKVNQLLKIVTVECYDRYLGILTKNTNAIEIGKPPFDEPVNKVKDWKFPKL